MKKIDAEQAIRRLCHNWVEAVGEIEEHQGGPSFSAFINWIDVRGYGQYLEFQSLRGAHADAELWFDEELRQTWRT